MSKIKMRCVTCGKWFQSANAKEVTCPDCTQKARKEKLALKNAPAPSSKPGGIANQGQRPAPPPPPKPKPAQSGTAQWLDSLQDVKVGQPEQPPARPKLPAPPVSRDNRSGPGAYREGGQREDQGRGPAGSREGGRGPGAYREDRERGPGGYRVGGGSGLPSASIGQRPRQPMEGGGFGRGPRPNRPPRPGGSHDGAPGNQKPRGRGKPGGAKPAAPPKPKREKIPPPQPFVPTPEQVTQVEERYIELATPSEFDGIRTQIAHELGIPKKAVKKIIKELRDRQNIPSWWELQTYKGPAEELERIKNAYLPFLPVPPVGVHKQIADQLDLKAGIVYQAIKAIRLEMNLPQYNDPELHGPEFLALLHKRKEQRAQAPSATDEASVTPAEPAAGEAGNETTAPSDTADTPVQEEVVSLSEGTSSSES